MRLIPVGVLPAPLDMSRAKLLLIGRRDHPLAPATSRTTACARDSIDQHALAVVEPPQSVALNDGINRQAAGQEGHALPLD